MLCNFPQARMSEACLQALHVGVSKKRRGPQIWTPNSRALILRTPTKRTQIFRNSHVGILWHPRTIAAIPDYMIGCRAFIEAYQPGLLLGFGECTCAFLE